MADNYISREEVLSRIYATHSTGGFANEEAYLWIHDEITNLSAADVQPVKHGRWMYPFYCSECGFEPYYASDMQYNYCSNCGCKQDLGGD